MAQSFLLCNYRYSEKAKQNDSIYFNKKIDIHNQLWYNFCRKAQGICSSCFRFTVLSSVYAIVVC